MNNDRLVASGGFLAPAYHTASEIGAAFNFYEVMPVFRALRGIDWTKPPEQRWAENREQELRDARQTAELERELAVEEWPWP